MPDNLSLDDHATIVAKLQGSFLLFTQTFFKILNGVEFQLSNPDGRESHFITIAKALTRAARLELPTQRLVLNVAPGSGKCIHADTPVLTKDGIFPIKSVTAGMVVMSWHKRHGWVWCRVTASQASTPVCLELIFKSGRRLICSSNHRWLTPYGFMMTSELAPGSKIQAFNAVLEDAKDVLLDIEKKYGVSQGEYLVPPSFVQFVWQILMFAGYIASIREDGRISLHPESLKDYLSDFGRADKYESVFRQQGYYYDEIKSIVDVGYQPCFDLQVNHTQTFLANGLVSHNSTLLAYWTAWTLARYPDSKYMYISYSKHVAARHTATIKDIISLPHYRELFDVGVAYTQRAKSHFKTTSGGEVMAFGSAGSITGMDAGKPNLERFSGALILDDLHKVDEAHSDGVREKVITNYKETIKSRLRGINVPQIFIGQRVHSNDIAQYFIDAKDGHEWEQVIIKSLDDKCQSFYPELYTQENLLKMKETERYVFASQHQQDPVPAGGALYQKHDFVILDEEPKNIYATFITADTAETDKTYNDATVFSFWGVYPIEERNTPTGEIGLHWLGCQEIWVEPRDLEDEFMTFWQQCALHPKRPKEAFIETKSTGTTLVSVLSKVRGMRVRKITRHAHSGSKAERFIAAQRHIAAKLISFTRGFSHVEKCVKHMCNVTANDTHARDDICFHGDTFIATRYGNKKIKNIRAGDEVITPFGYQKVTSANVTAMSASVINKFGLCATPAHKIFSGGIFKRLDTVNDALSLSHLNLSDLLLWHLRKLLISMETNTTSWGREGIICAAKRSETKRKAFKDCTVIFGSFIIKKEFLKGILFITKMATIPIIVLKILSAYHTVNIWRGIASKKRNMLKLLKLNLIFIKRNWQRERGIRVKPAVHGIEKMLKQAFTSLRSIFVESAASTISVIQPLEAGSALPDARGETGAASFPYSNPFALFAGAHFLTGKKRLETNQSQEVALKSAAHNYEYATVYNLTVENDGVYYANGILVSNCDTAVDAIRIVYELKLYPAPVKEDTRETRATAYGRGQLI